MTVVFAGIGGKQAGTELVPLDVPQPVGKGQMALAARVMSSLFGFSVYGFHQYNGLVVPASSGLWTPDDPALNVGSSVIDLEMLVVADSWMAAGNQILMSQRASGTQLSWAFSVNNGSLHFIGSPDGTSFTVNNDSTVTTRLANGTAHWVKMRFAPNVAGSRVLDFWTAMASDQPGEQRWKRLGAQITGASVASLFDSNVPVVIGNMSDFGPSGLKGSILYVDFRLNGVTKVSFDFRRRGHTTAPTRDDQGRTWTFDSPSSIGPVGLPVWLTDPPGSPWKLVADHIGGTGTAVDDHQTRVHVDRLELQGVEIGQQVFRQGITIPSNDARYTTGFESADMGTWGGFSANLTETQDPTVSHSGDGSLKITRTGSAGAVQAFTGSATDNPKMIDPAVPGEQITTSLWVRHDRPVAQNFFLRHQHYNANTLVDEISSANVSVPPGQWRMLTWTTTTPATTNRVQVLVSSATTNFSVGESMWVDDARFVRPPLLDALGQIVTYTRGGIGWEIDQAVGQDDTHGANRSVTATDTVDLKPGDVVVAFAAVDTDTDLSVTAPAITAAGITFGTTTRRTSGAGTDFGFDTNIEIFDATVTAGTSTAVPPTLTFTTAVSQCGPVTFVRLRETPVPVSGWRPTTDMLLELVDTPRRFDDFRFELVDTRNRRLGDVHPDLEKKPGVNWDTRRAVHRSLDNFHVPADEMADVNILTDRVRVWMRLQNGAQFSLGVFLWGDATEPQRPWGPELDGTLYDKTHILDQAIPNAISLGRGETPLVYARRSVRTYPEFSDQHFIEPDYRSDYESNLIGWTIASIGLEAAEKELNSPITWQPGTHNLEVLNDIMGLVTYMPVHCDRHGTLILRNAPLIQTMPVELTYSLARGRMIEDSIVRAPDYISAPNHVVVYDGSANSTPVRGEWFAPPTAPYSVQNRGYRKTVHETRTGLSNRTEADREAKRIGEWLVKAGDWIEWSSPADPRHDAYDILSVLGEKWMEVSWALPCVAGEPMTHRALKIYPDEEAA